MQVGYTWAMLTEHQLAMAAADLRNAALVVKHAGHYQGGLFNRKDGSVCAVGAIDLATYRKLVGPEVIEWRRLLTSPVYYVETVPANHENNVYRADAAIVCLAETIPLELCDDCPTTYACDCEHPACEEHAEPWKIVTHYNDNHCVRQDIAVNVMRMAAVKAEARIVTKRAAMVPA